MDIQELTKQFRAEDLNWTLGGVVKWLTEKKHVPPHIADFAMKKVLLQMHDGLIRCETHHGELGFDNRALTVARQMIKDDAERSVALLNKLVNASVNAKLKYLEDRIEEVNRSKKTKWRSAVAQGWRRLRRKK